MKKKYNIRINLGQECSYTLTGEDSDATFGFEAPVLVAENIETMHGNAVVKLCGENDYTIKRARLVSSEAPGVKAGSAPAGVIYAQVCATSEGSVVGQPLSSFVLTLNEWNEWEEKEIFVPKDSTGRGRLGQIVLSYETAFSIHDFNVQSEYVGASVKPVLEFEIEGDFVVGPNGNL